METENCHKDRAGPGPRATELAALQHRLITVGGTGAGLLLLLVVPLVRLLDGWWLNASAVYPIVGVTCLTAAWAPRLSAPLRSVLLVGALSVCLGAVGFTSGWSPGFVGAFSLAVVIGGLLLGRPAMLLLIGAAVAGFVAAAVGVSIGAFTVNDARFAPSVAANWFRVTVIFSGIALVLATVIRAAVASIARGYARAETSLASEAARRASAAAARRARIDAQRALREEQRLQAVGQLSSGLARLLGNAITVARGALGALKDTSSAADRRAAGITLGHALRHASDSVRDLMIFSRRPDGEAATVDLGDEVQRISRSLQSATHDDVKLTTRIQGGLRVALAPADLRQALLNVVLNAQDALPGGGAIHINVALVAEETTAPECQRGMVVVEDNGAGMASADLERALDPFFSTRAFDQHPGLGLPVAAGLIQQSGGELRIESGAGIGTRVAMAWPLVGPAPVRRPTSEDQASWPATALLDGGALRRVELAHDDEPTPAPAATDSALGTDWRAVMARRLALLMAVIVTAATSVAAIQSPAQAQPLARLVPPIILMLALAGGLPRLSQGARIAGLLMPIGLFGLLLIGAYTFMAPGAVAIVYLTVAWTALLGPAWAVAPVLLVSVATLLVTGALHSTGVLAAPSDPMSMRVASNWLRTGFVLCAVVWGLAESILRVLAHVDTATQALRASSARERALHEQEARDGDRLLELEQQRARNDRIAAAGRAAGTVAHDLNNALQSLSFWSECLGGRMPDVAAAEAITGARAAVDYAEALASQFSSAGTEEHGAQTPPHDLSELVRDTTRLLQSLVPDTIALETQLAAGCAVTVSPNDLRRILFNLITNARDAIDGDGCIRVAVESRRDRAVLEVSDTGRGMDEATRRRLFDAFFTTKPESNGTGLGAYTVATIVERTGGQIDVSSVVGTGSTLTLSWPAQQLSDRPGTAIPPTATARENRGTVLVAEDDPLVRQTIALTLRGAGYAVREATDGDAARQLAAAATDFVAMCLDGVMPGCSSAEVIEAFAAHHRGRPVLLCSGHLPSELTRRGLARDDVTFLPKPFGPQLLIETLESGLRRAGR